MKLPILSRAAVGAGKASEWLVLLYLLLATIPPILIRHHSLTVIPSLHLIDDSWIVDAVYKAAHGIWLGRDVAFTYGPIYEWMLSAPSLRIGLSLGSILATSQVVPYAFTILAIFCAARLLLAAATAWQRAIFVLLAVVFWTLLDFRTACSLLAFAVFLRLTDAIAMRGGAALLRAVVSALICLAAFLVSVDTGIYITAALLLCIAATAITMRRSYRPMRRFLLIALLCFGAGVLLVNIWMASLLDFRFWRSSLAIAAGYRWFEPSAMTKPDKHLTWVVLGLGLLVFSLAWWRRKLSGPWTRRPAFLLAGFLLSFLIIQSALVRSDHPHVLIGLGPMIILCGAIALDDADSKLLRATVPLAVIVATVVFVHPNPLSLPRALASRLHQFVSPIVTCPAGLQEFDGACLSPPDAELFSAVANYVDTNSQPGTPIVVFPYETAFGFVSHREVAGGVLQSYLATSGYLARREIRGLQSNRPPFGLYFPDGSLSVAVDSVPSATRSPELWLYLLRHYRGEVAPAPGVMGLIADKTRAGLTLRENPIANAPESFRIERRGASLDVGPMSWPASGADFIKLRLCAHYPPWWRVRKPSKLALLMSFDDGSEKSARFIVPPNLATDVWFYPWDDRDLGNYFLPDPAQWRPGTRPVPIRLIVRVDPFDWISVTPEVIEVEKVEAVRLEVQ